MHIQMHCGDHIKIVSFPSSWILRLLCAKNLPLICSRYSKFGKQKKIAGTEYY